MNNKNKPEFDKNTIKRLLLYIKKGHMREFIGSIICTIVSSLVGVVSSLFIMSLIDDYIGPISEGTKTYHDLLMFLIGIALVFVVGIVANYINNILLNKMSQSILRKIRDEMFEHMETLPIKYYDTNTHGDIMSYYTNDIDAIEQLYSQSINQILSTIITVITVFVSMVILSIPLTIVVIVTVLFMYFVMIKVSGLSGTYFKRNQNAIAKINGYIEEIINGQKVVKVFNHEEQIKKEFDEINDDWFECNFKANEYANILMPMMGNLTRLQYVIIAVAGGVLAINKPELGLTLGLIASFLQLSKNFSMPVSRLAQQVNSIVMALAGATRVFNLLDTPSEKDEGYITIVNVKKNNDQLIETNEKTNNWAFRKEVDGKVEYIELKGDVRLKDVVFGYNDDKEILHDISLYAKPGQKIAFVGATGAGKTTITNLINRFYDIKEGTITFDGINVKDIKKSDLRKSLGLVLQDTNLFTGTILENIKYGKDDATMDEVIEACKLANADSFIKRLPDGYNTMITNNGANLSQGQRQLLSIARCALINPPVMILDEATSSIDTRTEKIVQDGMDKLMNNRTVFVIAHRLSTVQNSKAIIVLDHGKIIERGSHDELLEQKGTYYQLYTGKFELE